MYAQYPHDCTETRLQLEITDWRSQIPVEASSKAEVVV